MRHIFHQSQGVRPRLARIWQPLQIPIVSVSRSTNLTRSSMRASLIFCAKALPEPVSSPYEKPPGMARIWYSSSSFGFSMRSLIWMILASRPL